MKIDRILYPITSLGPGKRIVVWTVGCSKHCKNCSNPELWDANEKREISAEKILRFIESILEKNVVDGITFTGGDPFEQPQDLLYLTEKLHPLCKDILVYTGYTEECLFEHLIPKEIRAAKNTIAVLIDGPYIDEKNDGQCCLRGSTNQRVLFYDASFRARYEEYMEKGRTLQNVYVDQRVISVGIHSKEEENG